MKPTTEDIIKALRFEASIYVGSSTSIVCAVAADLIEELQRELEDERYRHDRYADFCVVQGEELSKLKEQQRWIPVTERLPGEDDDVLIMSSGSINMGYYSTYNEYWVDYINVYYNDVTHWMPLPERPKEE